jgi:hypothetical protein
MLATRTATIKRKKMKRSSLHDSKTYDADAEDMDNSTEDTIEDKVDYTNSHNRKEEV